MTMATSAFSTFAAIGNREDLSNRIYRIDPTETPVFTAMEKTKATAVNHEWQTQALAAASTSNAQLEGDDNYAADAATPSVRLGNICQISRKTPRVTGTQQAVKHAGRDDEMDYQKMLKGMELRRDIEATITGANQAKVSGATTTARKLADMLSWIKTNTDKGGGTGADPTAADGTGVRVDAATANQRAFTENLLKNVLKKCYDNGGKPTNLFMGSFQKQAFSLFTGRGTPMEDQAGKKITAAVDVYESDFGKLKAVPDLFMRTRDVLVLQSDMWAYAPLPGRNFLSYPLAKTGDSEAATVLCEYTIEARNEKSSGGIFDLTSS
ncbi:head protein [Bradyrhizobium frederickii]|uniref:Head protein n=1 Tax=Bradyrhizobium frederickii TaxID=2560054 RepID=A0A4Y9NZP7_9BRAD|nr:DUF5309 domain-containing protein [Bradyrhizobium frederickii]TFV71675.1 head protein [Bradyrhizobium frederickii]